MFLREYRVVIADDDKELCATVSAYLAAQPGFRVVAVAHDGLSALQDVRDLKPEALLLDMKMPGADGVAVLKALARQPDRPKVVVVSAYADTELVATAVALGASYYIMKPFDLPTLAERLKQMIEPQTVSGQLRTSQRRRLIEREVTEHILALGVPQHFKGYGYLREAVALVVEDGSYLARMTKGLYPEVARRHGTTAAIVERAIRHAIEVTWTRGNLQAIHSLFAYSVDMNKGKPTNSSFVARLADQVRMQMRAG